MNTRRNVLLIGPLPCEGDVIGGTKVSFAALVDALRAVEALEVTVFDTARPRAGRGRLACAWLDARRLTQLIAHLARPGRVYDEVVLNTSSGGALQSGPLVWLLCRLRGVPLTLRVFGGDLDVFHARASRTARWLASRTVFRSRRVLLQTRALCTVFAELAAVEWWPTTRDLHVPVRTPRPTALRFLFLAQLRREKGIVEAVAASRGLPHGATLTVHGPPMPGLDVASLLPGPTWCYAGPVPSARVPEVLAAHDVLVFPSYHDGEGMPGIVIEAMQAGLPVIATRFRALTELVEDGVNGLLVEPRDERALAAALRRLAEEPELLARLASGARTTGERFRTGHWTATLCRWLGVSDADPSARSTPGRSDPNGATSTRRDRRARTSPNGLVRPRG